MKKILLIDDDEDEYGIFKEALEFSHEAFECLYAQSSDTALILLMTLIPDFIFIDFNMPKKSGLQCLSEIRKIKDFDEIPVIIYSTGVNDLMEKKAMALGATDCIKKTDSIERLSNALKKILST